MSESDLVVVTTTFAEQADAAKMAGRVVIQRAAACAQVDGPIESHYVWNDQVCVDREWRLTIKTTRQRLAELHEIVHANHPYTVPQWIVVAVESASPGYQSWVCKSCGDEGSTAK